MQCKFLGVKGNWREIANSANTTINKEPGTKEPSSQWKRRMLLCEHSPIRQLIFKAKWYGVKRWVSDHIVRHWLGIIHWVKTDRTDRTGIDRDMLSQANPTNHEIEANAQANINISRRRLCKGNASTETLQTWQSYLNSFKDIEPEMYSVCVSDCIYRGWCYEFKSCGYHKTQEYQKELQKYRENINL
jgi:hypothetical protein